jgi:hypothetical protein
MSLPGRIWYRRSLRSVSLTLLVLRGQYYAGWCETKICPHVDHVHCGHHEEE